MNFKFLFILVCVLACTLDMPAQVKKAGTRRPATTVKKTTQQVTVTQPKLIDLGLPSGTKWADRNMDATSTTSYGGFYAYGETTTKQAYTEENYSIDPETTNIAGTEYDAATKKYGKGWAIPTKEQWQELFSNCKQKLSIVNKLFVIQFTGENGNSIYLPFSTKMVMMINTPEVSLEANKRVLASTLANTIPSDIREGLKRYGLDLKMSIAMYRTAGKGEAACILGAATVSKSGNLKEYKKECGIAGMDDYIGLPIRPIYIDTTK